MIRATAALRGSISGCQQESIDEMLCTRVGGDAIILGGVVLMLSTA